jgi:drug/metabolite transporter (DMT)-like permease
MLIARGAAALTIFFWSIAYLWSKTILTWAGPFTASVARFSVAAIILLLVALAAGGLGAVLRTHWRSFLVLGLVGITLNQALLFGALNLTTAVNSAVIMALTPLLTMIGAAIWLGEPFGIRARIGLAVSLAGALLAVLGDGPRGIAGFTLDWGAPLALLAAGTMAFYTVASRRLVPPELPVLPSTAVITGFGTVLLLPLLLLEPMPRGVPPADVVAAWAGLSLGATVFALLAWMHATRLLGVGEPNMYYNFIPVLTMLLAAAEGSPPEPEQVIGGLLVVAGVVLSVTGRRASDTAAAPRPA